MPGVDSSVEFIARTTETGLLADAFARAAEGRPSVVIVGGEAGIGKTRLVEEFAEQIRDRALVLLGRCYPVSGRGLPYAPFGDLFRDLQRQVPPMALAAVLGTARDELRLLVPELDVRPSRVTRDDDVRAKAVGRARFFELLLGIAERLQALRPTVIAIDDLQWADAATLDVIRFLARGIRGGRLLPVLTTRTDDLATDDALLTAIGHVERAGPVQRIELRGFTRRELEAQIASILHATPEPDLVDRILAIASAAASCVLAAVWAGDVASTTVSFQREEVIGLVFWSDYGAVTIHPWIWCLPIALAVFGTGIALWAGASTVGGRPWRAPTPLQPAEWRRSGGGARRVRAGEPRPGTEGRAAGAGRRRRRGPPVTCTPAGRGAPGTVSRTEG